MATKIPAPSPNMTRASILSSSLPNMRASNWGDSNDVINKTRKPFIIGVAGGTASGKTSVCKLILERLGDHRVAIISQDSFYKNLSQEEKVRARNKDYNFDHPDAFDWGLMAKVLEELNEGKPVRIPEYDFVTHSRSQESMSICAVDIILFEGILVFYQESCRTHMDMKLFVEADADERLARRITRDIKERGRDLEGVLERTIALLSLPLSNTSVLQKSKQISLYQEVQIILWQSI